MSEREELEMQIQKKTKEIEDLKSKQKRKKSELQNLLEKKKLLEEKEAAAFNARVVAEMEQRFGKFDEVSLNHFLNQLDGKNNLSQ